MKELTKGQEMWSIINGAVTPNLGVAHLDPCYYMTHEENEGARSAYEQMTASQDMLQFLDLGVRLLGFF